MSTKSLIRRLFRLRSKSRLATQMRTDWDERARKNARHYVATLKEEWSDKEFFESGDEWIRCFILPDLPLICGNRSPSELRILEIGCGAGRMTHGLSELFGLVDAVDVSSEMVAIARTALAQRPNVTLHVNNGLDLSLFGKAEFDFVFSAIVFQHIPSKSIVIKYIREVARILRPGSVFKFQVQGFEIDEAYADTWVGVGFSEQEMRSLAKEIGFTIHDMSGSGTQEFWLTFIRTR
jgi:SAM-dependent methyltransferase